MVENEEPTHLTSKKFSRVYIEISNICNLQCDFCPEVERNKKVMSFELFKEVIDQVKDLTDEVAFHLMGEPLAHPQFTEFLGYCEQQKVAVNLTTNGTLLDHKNRESELLSPTVRQVNFSLQSYLSNYPGRPIDEYMSRIYKFTRRALQERPDLYINYRLWNIKSDLSAAPILKSIENEFSHTVDSENEIDVAFRKSRRIMGRLYLHFDSRFVWPSLKLPVSSESGFCYGLKSHFGIHADGTVVPCCLDKEAAVPLGQVAPNRFDAVLTALRSERAQNLREGFDKFEAREDLCKRCTFIRRFDKKAGSANNKLNLRA